MIFKNLNNKIIPTDNIFDEIYSKKYQALSERHFTTVKIAVKASKMLVDKPSDKILDIGSGIGKFCCIGASCNNAHFYGVEMRKNLVNVSNKIKRNYKLKNAHFINSDFANINFKNFDGIYFFNAFHENFDSTCILDDKSKVSLTQYKKFHESLTLKLNDCKSGTKLVTFHTFKNRIPKTFQFIDKNETGLLKFYIKK